MVEGSFFTLGGVDIFGFGFVCLDFELVCSFVKCVGDLLLDGGSISNLDIAKKKREGRASITGSDT